MTKVDEVGDWAEYTKDYPLAAMKGFLRTGAPEFVHYMFKTHKTPQGAGFWMDLGTVLPGKEARQARARDFVERVRQAILDYVHEEMGGDVG